MWHICIFSKLTTEKDLSADRKLSKLDIRSSFPRINSSPLLAGAIVSNTEKHTFSTWLNSKLWLIYITEDSPPRIQRRSTPQKHQPQTSSYLTLQGSVLAYLCCPVSQQHSTLDEKLYNSLQIIHCCPHFCMLELNRLHPLLFSCSHASVCVTKPVLCNGDAQGGILPSWYSRCLTGYQPENKSAFS